MSFYFVKSYSSLLLRTGIARESKPSIFCEVLSVALLGPPEVTALLSLVQVPRSAAEGPRKWACIKDKGMFWMQRA